MSESLAYCLNFPFSCPFILGGLFVVYLPYVIGAIALMVTIALWVKAAAKKTGNNVASEVNRSRRSRHIFGAFYAAFCALTLWGFWRGLPGAEYIHRVLSFIAIGFLAVSGIYLYRAFSPKVIPERSSVVNDGRLTLSLLSAAYGIYGLAILYIEGVARFVPLDAYFVFICLSSIFFSIWVLFSGKCSTYACILLAALLLLKGSAGDTSQYSMRFPGLFELFVAYFLIRYAWRNTK